MRKLRSLEALQQIQKALFPKPTQRIMPKGETYFPNETYHNLEGAISDLIRTHADVGSIRTIEAVQGRIEQVADILERSGIELRD